LLHLKQLERAHPLAALFACVNQCPICEDVRIHAAQCELVQKIEGGQRGVQPTVRPDALVELFDHLQRAEELDTLSHRLLLAALPELRQQPRPIQPPLGTVPFR
jgi:hypothetical protein